MRSKRLVGILLLASTVCGFNLQAADYKVTKEPYNIGGQQITMDSLVNNKTTYVELHSFLKHTGLVLGASNKAGEIGITEARDFRGHLMNVVYDMNSNVGYSFDSYSQNESETPFNYASIQGAKKISAMPIKHNNKLYIPIRDVAIRFGFSVGYVNGKTVIKGDLSNILVTAKEREFMDELTRESDRYFTCMCEVYGNDKHYVNESEIGYSLMEDIHYFIDYNNGIGDFECYMINALEDSGYDKFKISGYNNFKNDLNKFKASNGSGTDTFNKFIANYSNSIQKVEAHQKFVTAKQGNYTKANNKNIYDALKFREEASNIYMNVNRDPHSRYTLLSIDKLHELELYNPVWYPID